MAIDTRLDDAYIEPAEQEAPSLLERLKKLRKAVAFTASVGAELARERADMPRFVARALSDESEITQARIFATDRFVQKGKIDPTKVHQEGELKGLLKNDSLHEASTYFGVYEGDELVATARFVHGSDMNVRGTRMPFEELSLENQALLDAIPAGKSAEFASLAKAEGVPKTAVLKLIRAMVQWSYENDIQYFTSGLEPKVYPDYQKYFGGALTRLHPKTVEFPGIKGDQVPILVDLGDSLEDGFEGQKRGQRRGIAGIGAVATRAAVRAILR